MNEIQVVITIADLVIKLAQASELKNSDELKQLINEREKLRKQLVEESNNATA